MGLIAEFSYYNLNYDGFHAFYTSNKIAFNRLPDTKGKHWSGQEQQKTEIRYW